MANCYGHEINGRPVEATTRSENPAYADYNLCADCARFWDNQPIPDDGHDYGEAGRRFEAARRQRIATA